MIPAHIKIENGKLPDSPGVYFYYDADGALLYVGKATSLKKRVGSYFAKQQEGRLEELVSRIARIEYQETPTVIEALVLEANEIKARKPAFNILQRDDKTYLFLTITNEDFPRVLLMRGSELAPLGVDPFEKELSAEAKKKFLAVYGPYPSASSLRKALDLVRKFIAWSDCESPIGSLSIAFSRSGLSPSSSKKQRLRLSLINVQRPKPCFNVHLGRCPGVCAGLISKADYCKIIRQLQLFFEGKKSTLIRQYKKEMAASSKVLAFEKASDLRNRLQALEHIRDVALITREDVELPFTKRAAESGIDLEGRIEAYDISNISGTDAVGSMVVFVEGKPAKSLYRKFKIKTVSGPNDVAMLEEVMRRRIARTKTHPHAWSLPQVMVIDGGEGQVARVKQVMKEFDVNVPMLGIAKGFDRKQDRLVYNVNDAELARIATRGKELFQRARDEAHRFAVAYHRKLRSKL